MDTAVVLMAGGAVHDDPSSILKLAAKKPVSWLAGSVVSELIAEAEFHPAL